MHRFGIHVPQVRIVWELLLTTGPMKISLVLMGMLRGGRAGRATGLLVVAAALTCTGCASSGTPAASAQSGVMGDLKPVPSPTTFMWSGSLGGPDGPNQSTPCPGKWSSFLTLTGGRVVTAAIVCPANSDAAARRYVYVEPSRLPALLQAVEKAPPLSATEACPSDWRPSTKTVELFVVDTKNEVWEALGLPCRGDDPGIRAAVAAAAVGGQPATN